MRSARYVVAAIGLSLMLAAPALAREFDVCVDPATGLKLPDGTVPGFSFVAVGQIFPGGTLGTFPGTGIAADCSDALAPSIGTFFASGHSLSGVGTAAASDLFFVDWHFRIGSRGAIDTTGIVQSGSTYTQTVVGATGGLAPSQGQAMVEVFDPSNSGKVQFRIILPSNQP